MFACVSDVAQELGRIANVERNDVARGEHHGISVNRERGGRNDRRIAGAHQGQTHVAERLFRSQAGDHFIVAVQFDPILRS